MGDPIAAGLAAVDSGHAMIKSIMGSVDQKMKIGCTIVNNTNFTLKKLSGSGSLHHGKTYQAPAAIIGPLDMDSVEKGAFLNHSEWAIRTSGAHCSEGIVVYSCQELNAYFCFYLKHGHNFEAGCFVIDEHTWKDESDSFEKSMKHNKHWKYPQKNRTGEKVIHYIQKFKPKGKRNKPFGKYCTKDTSGEVSFEGNSNKIFVRFQAAESVEFNITQKDFTEPA